MQVHSTASVVAILNETCGRDAASKLVEAFGGQEITVPKTVSGRLVEALGPEITAVLVDHFGGCRLNVPSRGHALRIQKSLHLRQDVLTSNLSANEIAARHGVTVSWVRKLRSMIHTPDAAKPRKI